MSKRSERDRYFHAFDDIQPFDGLDVYEVFDEIKWGNDPTEAYEINAPEPMAGIGTLAKLRTSNGTFNYSEKNAPFLCVGTNTNLLYIIPRDIHGGPKNIPNPAKRIYKLGPKVYRTDYYSDKGGEHGYYYHKHEKPFPYLLTHGSGVSILLPSNYDGMPSYRVIKDGIVG